MPIPKLTVEKDYDGFFEAWVRGWMERKAPDAYQHKEIVITAGPYRPYAVSFDKTEDGVLRLDFYSALRAGFGGLLESDIKEIIDLM